MDRHLSITPPPITTYLSALPDYTMARNQKRDLVGGQRTPGGPLCLGISGHGRQFAIRKQLCATGSEQRFPHLDLKIAAAEQQTQFSGTGLFKKIRSDRLTANRSLRTRVAADQRSCSSVSRAIGSASQNPR